MPIMVFGISVDGLLILVYWSLVSLKTKNIALTQLSPDLNVYIQAQNQSLGHLEMTIDSPTSHYEAVLMYIYI